MSTITRSKTDSQGRTRIEVAGELAVPISELESIPLRIWFEGVQVPAAGIASVFTHERERRQGHARRCIHHALNFQRECGCLVSLLFGIPGYYERFGYNVVMAWHGVSLPVPLEGELGPEPQVLPIAGPLPADCLDLYRTAVHRQIGPVVRGPEGTIGPSRPVHWRARALCRCLVGRQGEVRGYVTHNEPGAEDLQVAEAFAVDNTAWDQLLSYLGHEARRRGKKRVLAALPPDDPCARFLSSRGARLVTAFRASGGGMARILNLTGLCRTLRPVFQQRLSVLPTARIPRTLVLQTEEALESMALAGAGEDVRLLAPQPVLTQLLFGYVTVAEARDLGAVWSGAADLAWALFPRRHAFMYLTDRF